MKNGDLEERAMAFLRRDFYIRRSFRWKNEIHAVPAMIIGRLRRDGVGNCQSRPQKSLLTSDMVGNVFDDVSFSLGSVFDQVGDKKRRDNHKEREAADDD